MGKKKSSADREELTDLIAKYETAKAEDRQLYLDGDQLADIADWYASERKFTEAQEVINYGLHLHPGNTDLLIQQSYLYLDTQNLHEAIEVASNITEEYDFEVKMLKTELLLNQGKLEEAKQITNAIEDDDKDQIIDIVKLYIDMGYPADAKEWLEKGQKLYGEDEDYLTLIVDYLGANQQTKEAIPYFNKLLDMAPFNPSYWMGLAKCYFIEENIEKTIEACDFALAIDDKFGEAYGYKAHCFFYLNNPDAAIENYQKSIEYRSIPPELGYMFMGMSYGNKEEWQKADDCYEKVISIFEENEDVDSLLLIDTYNSKANAVIRLGRYEEAHQLCDKARKINPDDSLIFVTEGKIYLAQEKKKEAARAFNKAVKTSPCAEMWYMIGSTYSEFNYIAETKKCYEKAYKMNPKYEDLPERLSIISIVTNNFDDFLKYNKECARPFKEETIQKLLDDLNYNEEDEPILKKILQCLKEGKENNK